MPVSALPSSTGVGELGADTFRFIKNLKHSGVKIWQILPLNPAGYGNSPYQPYSPVREMKFISVWKSCISRDF